MPPITSFEALNSCLPRKRFGKRYRCGCAVCAEALCGDDGIFGWLYGCGIDVCGVGVCGSDDELTGIYHVGHYQGHVHIDRLSHMWTNNPNSPAQQTNRTKFAAAVVSWQGLTSEQKAVYSELAVGKHMSGYNFYIRKYLLSN